MLGENKVTAYVPTAGIDIPLAGTAYNLQPGESEHMANGAHLASLYGVSIPLPIALSAPGLKEYFKVLTELGKNPFSGAQEKAFEEKTWYVHTLIKGNVEWGKEARGTNQGDYHDYFEIEVSKTLPLVSSRLVFEGRNGNGDFITNATSCPGHLTTTIQLTDAEHGLSKSEYAPPKPLALTGCPLEFKPGFAFSQGSNQTDEPSEFTAEASETHNPKAIDQSQVKSASFVLPEGMTLNPSAANELEDCKPSQAHEVPGTEKFTEEFGVACPEKSKIGTVTLNVPTLGVPLTGAAYLGGPESGSITGPPFTMYVVANSAQYGVSVRLVAKVIPNEATGRVTTVFSSPPEQPFTNIAIHFERNVLAPVANPLVCGEPKGAAVFEPTAAPGSAVADAFGIKVTGCASIPPPFSPGQSTSTSNGNAGASTQFTFNLGRNNGEQYLGSIKTELPPGLAGKIAAAERCGEPAAGSETAACPAGSEIGKATVVAGSGLKPYTFSGPVYLTGPYNGNPYGMSIKVPAVAGPFNFGTVVDQAGITVNPLTAQVIITSSLPRIRKGVPLRIRSISVAITKSGFMVNPTNCSKFETVSTVGGFAGLETGAATATKLATSPFQVSNCNALKFSPKFKASSSAKVSRANGAMLTTEVTQSAGQANIKSVKVQLPKTLPSRQSTLKQSCTEQQFAINPFRCPSGAFVGGATVHTPLLPQPLKGPAIFVSHAGASFPDLDLVVEDPNHLRVILVGNTFISKGITTTTFASTPDDPISSVRVELPTGSHSALGAYGNVCAKALVMPTTITSQNGKTIKQNTIINVANCPVEVVGKKVVGNSVLLTVRVPGAGRVSASGVNLKTVYRRASKAHQVISVKVPLSSIGERRFRPLPVHVRVGFVPKKGKHSSATVQVVFH